MRHRIQNELSSGRVLGAAITSAVLFLTGCTVQEAGHPVAAEPQTDQARFDRLLKRGFEVAACLMKSSNSLVEPGPNALSNNSAIWGSDSTLNTDDDGRQNVFMVAERPFSGPPTLYMHLARKVTFKSDREESLTVKVVMKPGSSFAKAQKVTADLLQSNEIDHNQSASVAYVTEPGQGLMLLRNGDQISFRNHTAESSDTLHPIDDGRLDIFGRGLTQNIISLTEAAGAHC